LHSSEHTDPIWNAKFRILEAEILIWQRRLHEAAALIEPSLPEELLTSEFAVRREIAQARVHYLSRQFGDAALNLAEAQKIASASHPTSLPEVDLVRATSMYLQDEFSQAERELIKARSLAAVYKNSIVESEILGTFGALYTRQGFYDKALDYSLAALALSQTLHARHVEAATRLNIGWTYLELGDFQQAIPSFESSEKLAEQAGMLQPQQESLNSLGRVYFNEAKYQAAADYYTRALSIARKREDQQAIGLYLDNLALVFLAMGRLDEADTYNQNALEIQRKEEDHEQELRSLRTAASVADARKAFVKAKSILDSILSDKMTPLSVQWEAEGELADLYVNTGKTAAAQNEFNKALALLDRSWESIKNDENKLAFASWTVNFYTDYISFLLSQGNKAKAFQIAESMRARTLEEGLDGTNDGHERLINLPAVQAYLKNQQQVVFAYWLAPKRSFLWVVTPSQLEVFLLPSKDQIEAKVEEYQNIVTHLGDPLKDDQLGQELYRILIEPAKALVPRGTRVAVIPDGKLGKLNFETLVVPSDPPHYWIDEVEMKESSSISLLVQSKPNVLQNRGILIIGDPVQVTPEYGRLVNARDEIGAAAKNFPGSAKVISGPAATPSSYEASTPRKFDIIHFATHGFASDTRPLDSAIILSSQADGIFKLYGRDIVKIPIKADVVTISACYGAGERTYSGEGLVGLAWAFMRAGAHRVIAGLWKVDDQSTPELMNNFYAELKNGTRVAAALRDAKLKMVHSTSVYRLPYYWASLQLYSGS
jgi:CHAT domain-containing protein/Tfp pilus assembly protein PilF